MICLTITYIELTSMFTIVIASTYILVILYNYDLLETHLKQDQVGKNKPSFKWSGRTKPL